MNRTVGVQEVYLGGYAAEACVHATYRGGQRLGFSMAKIHGGVASGAALLLWMFDRMGKSEAAATVERAKGFARYGEGASEATPQTWPQPR